MNLTRVQESAEQLDLAIAALDAKLPDLAHTHLRKALELDPSQAEARLAEARLHLVTNEPTRALSALDAHELYHPTDRGRPDVAMLRVEALLRAGIDDLALALLQQLVRDFPDDVRPHRLTAGLCLKLGKQEQAAAALREVLRLSPSDRAARITLVQILASTAPDAAIDLLRREENANDPTLPTRLARLYRLAGRYREANDIYDTLLRRDPDAAPIHHAAGTLADALGDHGGAVEHLRRAGELDPRGGGESLAALAAAHMHAGETLAAARTWWRAARLRSDPRAWAGLLVCALAEKRFDLVRRLHRMISLQTSKQERRTMILDQWVHLAGGLALRQAIGRIEPAASRESPLQELLEKAEEALAFAAQNGPRADQQFHLAVCRAALDDQTGAAEALESALAVNPRYAAAIRLREQITTPTRIAA